MAINQLFQALQPFRSISSLILFKHLHLISNEHHLGVLAHNALDWTELLAVNKRHELASLAIAIIRFIDVHPYYFVDLVFLCFAYVLGSQPGFGLLSAHSSDHLLLRL